MSFKLKAIELEAFRAYKDKQVFNFESSIKDKLSNLVVLYAPNGFGKTSLFDAVEWSISGKIGRITDNSVVRNVAEVERGNILKNIESDDSFGRVKLIGENENILEVKTKVLGAYRRTTDYDRGDIICTSEDFLKLMNTDYCTTNLLTHDKIDTFLRFSDPKHRYEALSGFWDTHNDTHIYRSVMLISHEVSKKKDKIKEEIQMLKSELEKSSFSIQDINKLRLEIRDFNETNHLKLVLNEMVQYNPNDNLSKCIEFKLRVNIYKSGTEAKKANINALRNEYLEYSKNNESIALIKNKLKELTSIIEKYDELENIYGRKTSLEQLKKTGIYQLEKYNKLQSGMSQYLLAETEIKKLIDINHILSQEITTIDSHNSSNQIELYKLSLEVKKLEVDLKEKVELYEKVEQDYLEYKKLVAKLQYYNKRKPIINNVLEIRSKRIKNWEIDINEQNNILSKNNVQLFQNEYKYNKFNKEYYSCKSIYTLCEELKDLLKQKEKEYLEYGKLNEQINNIIKSGKALIEQTKTNKCPLCNKEYDNFEKLIENVNKGIEDTLGLNKIYKEIEGIKKLIFDKETELKRMVSSFRQCLKIDIENLFEKIKIEKLHIIRTSELDLRHSQNEVQVGNLIEEIKSIYFKYSINFAINDSLRAKEILYGITEKQKSLLEQERNRLTIINDNIIKAGEEKVSKQNSIQSNLSLVDKYKSNPKYVEVINLLEELSINLSTTNIDKEVEMVNQTISEKDQVIAKLNERIVSLEKELCDKNKEEIEKTLISMKSEYLRLGEIISNFESRLQAIFEGVTNKISLETLEKLENHLDNEIEENNNLLDRLIGIETYLENMIKNKDWLDKNEKLNELEKQLKIILKAGMELSSAKDISISHITKQIDRYFDVKIINQIYGRIEPHPNLTYVKFSLDFHEDVPELNIHAFSDDGKQKVEPILYLSSAQINILSLSIFLAKTLHKKNSIMSTIFMDDPIQHLDSINILSFIDLIRTIITDLDRQIIISTHNENFYRLLMKKIDPEYFRAKYIELNSYGTIKV